MTTKTQLAMVAIAAVAAMSFGFTPAFASHYAYVDVDATASGTAYADMDIIDCGTGECVSDASTSASQDYVTYWYGMWWTNNTCDVTTELSVTGETTQTFNHGVISGLHSERVNMNVDAGDTIVVVNYYSNCT